MCVCVCVCGILYRYFNPLTLHIRQLLNQKCSSLDSFSFDVARGRLNEA